MSIGPVMLDVQGLALTPEEREVLQHPAVGGVILFSRNYESPAQVARLAADIHALRQPPLLIAVDQEGGRVQRFRDGFFRLPAVGVFAGLYDENPGAALALTQEAGWLMASEVLSVGVDLSFAPVLDLDLGMSAVIGDRAFHRYPEAVTELALAYQRGMHEAGMASVGKHFPGHGGVVVDSHHGLPEDQRTLADLELQDLIPFARLAHNGLNSVMVAHVLYPQVDSQPAGFSRRWLTDILRDSMQFQGVIFSDDLSMGGAAWAGDYPQRAQLALEAGCDMVLVCNQPEHAIEVIESLSEYNDPAAHLRLARMHGRHFPQRDALCKSQRWQTVTKQLALCENDNWLDMDLE
ncbi:beta-N-acetylglucosaminidase [hydrothermal vent metagenome]|uniref:beta-N-acetylhexosaminidase n=1 Tax=hydrothermal vent metagenome TaxID=652676 RepID=A0A3B0Y273_9ZZZZ